MVEHTQLIYYCHPFLLLPLVFSTEPSLADSGSGKSSVKSINGGRGQEITGVTLPEQGMYLFFAYVDRYLT